MGEKRVALLVLLVGFVFGTKPARGTKPVPAKVILWLTDPLVIELPIFVPPENARIVPVDNRAVQSNSDQDNAAET